MITALRIIQVLTALLLIGSVLLQQRGSSLGVTFGGSGESYRSKRGLEKFLFYVTIVLAVLFASVTIFTLVIS